MVINLAELLRFTNKIVGTLSLEMKTIEVPQDFYWAIVTALDGRIGIGSLADDWMMLQKLLNNSYIVSNLDIERLGNIFIAIGEELEGVAYHEEGLNDFSISIDYASLSAITRRIFATAIFQDIVEVEIEKDLYKRIKPEDRFHIYKMEPEIVTYSLPDEMCQLKELEGLARKPAARDLVILGRILVVLTDQLYESDIHIIDVPKRTICI